MPENIQVEERLDTIINNAPESAEKMKQTFVQKAKQFCMSSIGISVLSFVLFFLGLLLLRPNYIFKKDQDGNVSKRKINFGLVTLLAVIGALAVLFIPMLILRKK